MNKILIIAFSSSMLFGSDIYDTDFIPRLVNFLIFAGIIYYLLFDKLRVFLDDRKEGIQGKLSQAQEKLSSSKKQKIQAHSKIQESEKLALEIIKMSKDECKHIAKQYKKQTEQMLITIKKSYEDRMILDARSVKIDITKNILDDAVDDAFSSISQDQIVEIINTKIAKKRVA